MRWRAVALVREARLNSLSGWARLVAYYAVVGGILVASAVFVQQSGLETRLMELEAQGRDVYFVTASESSASVDIDRRSCEGLASRPDIERSGATVPQGRFDFETIGASVPLLASSRQLVPELGEHDIVVGRDLGLPIGSRRLVLFKSPTTAYIGGKAIPGTGLSSSVAELIDSSVTSTDHCVIVVSSWAARDVAAEAASSLVVVGDPIMVRPVLRETLDTLSEYRLRSERLLPLALGVTGALLTYLTVIAQPSRLAAYRLSGSTAGAVAGLIALECAHVAGVYVASGSLALYVIAGASPESAAGVTWLCLGGVLWWVLGSTSAVLSVRNPFDLGKDG